MDLKINQGELASDLAVKELNRQYEAEGGGDKFPNGIVRDEDADCTEYTEEAQETYNTLYDEYWEMIGSCKV